MVCFVQTSALFVVIELSLESKRLSSLRQAARPDEVRTRRCERTVKLWLLEAKAIPPKKRYYCEILLDDTLYARYLPFCYLR